MSKVLVDRERLERIASDDEGAASLGDFEELKQVLAQPAEAQGVDRQRIIEAMCLTWRHDFGLDKPEGCPLSSGMTEAERDGLRRQMGQLFDHHRWAPLARHAGRLGWLARSTTRSGPTLSDPAELMPAKRGHFSAKNPLHD